MQPVPGPVAQLLAVLGPGDPVPGPGCAAGDGVGGAGRSRLGVLGEMLLKPLRDLDDLVNGFPFPVPIQEVDQSRDSHGHHSIRLALPEKMLAC